MVHEAICKDTNKADANLASNSDVGVYELTIPAQRFAI